MQALRRTLKTILARNKSYYAALVAIIALSTWINFSSDAHLVILNYYREFANLIQEGIYSSDYYRKAGTFPMWGYGFVLAVTQNKTLILVMQQLLNLMVIICFDTLMRHQLKSFRLFLIYRLVLLFSFSLFFFHAVLWPYSFNSSFLLLGILLLARFYQGDKQKPGLGIALLSGICIGISLNFRSDYLYCIYGILLVTLAVYGRQYRVYRHKVYGICLWFLAILLMLAPWAAYTKKANGHYMFNSTNAGHVLYIGLGQLPGNKWQIQPYDDDSTMGKIIHNNLEQEKFSTTTYAADSLLKQAWKSNVIKDPFEYLKKCTFTFFSIFIQPFVEGDGFKASFSDDELMTMRESMRKLQFGELFSLMLKNLSASLIISIFTAALAIILYLIFWINLIRSMRLIPLLMKTNKFLLISLVFIIYQLLLLSAGYYHRDYNTNLYLLYVAVIFILADERNNVHQSRLNPSLQ